jgi:hypothetical protein
MRRIYQTVFIVLLILLVQTAPAQSQDPTWLDNHYLVYDVVETITVPGPVFLDDQWGHSEHPEVFLDKFANPVMKNGEPIVNEALHQTWWQIDDVQSGRRVFIENQFGPQVWFTKDARYLVLPASKNVPTPLPDGTGQHYKCYEAQGPPMDLPVQLQDQWGFFDPIVAEPVLFCNPVFKTFQGVTSPTLNDSLHMACYRLEPPQQLIEMFFAWDQFGLWEPLTVTQAEWLCVPSAKLEFIGVEPETWGNIKKRFR